MPGPEKTERNRELYADHLAGMSYQQLSRKYTMSIARVGELVARERKREAVK